MRCALSVIEAAGSPLARPVGGAGFSRPSAASGLVSRPGAPCASAAGTIAHDPGRGIEALSAGTPARRRVGPVGAPGWGRARSRHVYMYREAVGARRPLPRPSTASRARVAVRRPACPHSARGGAEPPPEHARTEGGRTRLSTCHPRAGVCSTGGRVGRIGGNG
jgi:hypothetical protein